MGHKRGRGPNRGGGRGGFRGGGRGRGGGGGSRGRGERGNPDGPDGVPRPSGLSGRDIGMFYAARSKTKKVERERNTVYTYTYIRSFASLFAGVYISLLLPSVLS